MTEDAMERALLTLLADARPHGLQQICKRLVLSSSDLDDVIARIEDKGLEIERHTGTSICLPRPVQLLDEARIRKNLSDDANARLANLQVLWSTDSTNAQLLAKPMSGEMHACLAEFQTAGRGRQQRQWRAPLGGGLCLSVSYALPGLSEHVAAIGLAAGVAVQLGLEKCGARNLKLKWPNDLVWNKRKVGGLLCELCRDSASESNKSHCLVVGVGLNYRLDTAARAEIIRLGGLEPADMEEACAGNAPDRNSVAAAVLQELIQALSTFVHEGFEPFVSAWRAVDACKDAPVIVSMQSGKLDGVARGIDASGALQLEVDGNITRIVSADVSMRPA